MVRYVCKIGKSFLVTRFVVDLSISLFNVYWNPPLRCILKKKFSMSFFPKIAKNVFKKNCSFSYRFC